MLVGTVFALSAVMMGAKFYIDRNVQREDVRPYPSCRSNELLTCRAPFQRLNVLTNLPPAFLVLTCPD